MNKPIESVEYIIDVKGAGGPDSDKKEGEKQFVPLEIIDSKSFKIYLQNIRTPRRLKVQFIDTDGAEGSRVIEVTPRIDNPPVVQNFRVDEVIRKVREGERDVFLVTPKARLPFRASVKDDRGLGQVRYAVSVAQADFLLEENLTKSIPLLSQLLMTLPGDGAGFQPLHSVLRSLSNSGGWNEVVRRDKERREQEQKKGAPAEVDPTAPQYVELEGFRQAIRGRTLQDKRGEVLPRDVVSESAKSPQRDPYRDLIRQLDIDPDEWKFVTQASRFDLQLSPGIRFYERFSQEEAKTKGKVGEWVPLLEQRRDRVQRTYLVDVWLEVEDTYLIGERKKGQLPVPHRSRSAETLTFKVVRENELLARIADEEDLQRKAVNEAYGPVYENKTRVTEINLNLATPTGLNDGLLDQMAARIFTLDSEVLSTSEKTIRAVYGVYQRIYKEEQLNQVDDKMLARVIQLRDLLGELSEERFGHFTKTRQAMQGLLTELNAKKSDLGSRVSRARARATDAKNEMNALVAKLNEVLGLMEQLSTLNDLIRIIEEVEKAEAEDERAIQKRIENLIAELFGGTPPKK